MHIASRFPLLLVAVLSVSSLPGCDTWHGPDKYAPRTPTSPKPGEETPGQDAGPDRGAELDADIVSPAFDLEVQSGESVRFEGLCSASDPVHHWTLDGVAQQESSAAHEIRFVIPGTVSVGYACNDALGNASALVVRQVRVRASLTLVYQTQFESPIRSQLYGVPMSEPSVRYKLNPELPANGARVRSIGYSPDGAWLFHNSTVQDGRSELFVRRRTGGATHALSAGISGAFGVPSVSPDGRWALFTANVYDDKLESSAGDHSYVQLADLSTTPPKVIKLGEAYWLKNMVWAGDSSALAFQASQSMLQIHWPKKAAKVVSIPLPMMGGVRSHLLSPDGERIAFMVEFNAQRRLFTALTDGTQQAVEITCPEGRVLDLPLLTNDRVVAQCSVLNGNDTAGVSSFAGNDWTALGRGVVAGPRCGSTQMLYGTDGLLAVSIVDGRLSEPRMISSYDGESAPYPRAGAFSSDCTSFFYLDVRVGQVVRLSLTSEKISPVPEPISLPEPASLWREGKLWPSPKGEMLLVGSKDALAVARWSEFPSSHRAEPGLHVRGGAGFLDETTAVVHGSTSPRADDILLKLTYDGTAVYATRVVEQGFGRAKNPTDAPPFVLAPDAVTGVFVANSAPREDPNLHVFGSGSIPLQVDFATGAVEPVLEQAGASLGGILEVSLLGGSMFAFTAAVDFAWESVLFVHDMTDRYRVSPVDPVERTLTPITSSLHAQAATFSLGETVELLHVPSAEGVVVPGSRVIDVSLYTEGATFTADGQWYLAHEKSGALVAVHVETGDVRPLSQVRISRDVDRRNAAMWTPAERVLSEAT